jgi:hypothetical protein
LEAVKERNITPVCEIFIVSRTANCTFSFHNLAASCAEVPNFQHKKYLLLSVRGKRLFSKTS